jgi:hypothetical protein
MRTRTWIIVVAVIAVVALAGAVYTTGAFASGRWQAKAPTGQPAQTLTDSQIRENILDMLDDHMGITGAEAEKLADQMLERCGRLADGDGDGIGSCPGITNGTNGSGDNWGPGMMNGTNRGPGMMNGTTPGQMMGGREMMGGWGR